MSNLEIAKKFAQYIYSKAEAECFSKLPVMNKMSVCNEPEKFINNTFKSNKIISTQTSGSSGLILKVLWDELDYFNSLSEIWKIRIREGVMPSDKYCSLHVGYTIKGKYIRNKVIINKNNISLSKCFLDKDSVLFYYKSLQDFSPVWMMVQPAYLYAFLSALSELHLMLPDSVKLIELTGEYCSKDLLDSFKKMYPNVKWRIMYGMQEFNVIAYGDDLKLRTLDNNVYVEILDDNLMPTPIDQVGDIIITGLKNKYMPLIRYKTGDRGKIDKNGNLIIEQARSNDSIIFNGQVYDGSIFWDLVLYLNFRYKYLIKQFQIIFDANVLNFNFVTKLAGEISNEEISKNISKYLKDTYACDYPVVVNFVSDIQPCKKSNKIKYFINKTHSDVYR